MVGFWQTMLYNNQTDSYRFLLENYFVTKNEKELFPYTEIQWWEIITPALI